MAVGEIISAARYNALQAKIANVVGIGSDQYGYGQTLASSLVSLTNNVSAQHMVDLKTDIIKARVHQTGSNSPALTTVAIAEDITDAVYVEYENIVTTLFNNKNDIYELTQADVEVKLNSTRNTTWGGASQPQTIYHEFNVTFTDANHRRYFFNAGGEIRFSASLTGVSGAKSLGWAGLLSSMSTIKFDYTGVSAGSGTPTAIGNFDLTNSYQTIYTKNGSGIYSQSSYIIRAKQSSASQITFQIALYDGENNFVDEVVNGTLTSSISQLRPVGLYVEVSTPTYQNVTTLS
jgi:hypothetical protein